MTDGDTLRSSETRRKAQTSWIKVTAHATCTSSGCGIACPRFNTTSATDNFNSLFFERSADILIHGYAYRWNMTSYYRYGQRFRRVRFVNERFNASFLPMWHMADINNHFVSDCTREVRTEGRRGECTCFTPNPFSITGTVIIWHVSECVPGILSIYISLRHWRMTPAQRLI